MTYPTATLDRLQLRSDQHAERKPVRKSRTVATPVLLNRAVREVQHWESQIQERDSDLAGLLSDPTVDPECHEVQRVLRLARQAREDLGRARAALAKLEGGA